MFYLIEWLPEHAQESLLNYMERINMSGFVTFDDDKNGYTFVGIFK